MPTECAVYDSVVTMYYLFVLLRSVGVCNVCDDIYSLIVMYICAFLLRSACKYGEYKKRGVE